MNNTKLLALSFILFLGCTLTKVLEVYCGPKTRDIRFCTSSDEECKYPDEYCDISQGLCLVDQSLYVDDPCKLAITNIDTMEAIQNFKDMQAKIQQEIEERLDRACMTMRCMAGYTCSKGRCIPNNP